MTAATPEKCNHCGAWQNVAVLGDVCTSCGRLMVAVEHQATTLVDPPAPCPLLVGRIINRVVFKSRSLRRAEQAAGNPPRH